MIWTKRRTRKKKKRPAKMATLSTRMTRKTKKQTRNNKHTPLFSWHPPVSFPPSKSTRSSPMQRLRWITVPCTAALFASLAVAIASTQEPASSPPSSAPAAQTPEAGSNKPNKKKYSHANDFLIRGTVFNENALSFPGVQLRIRRTKERKFRWESLTNSRGEFAVRVPQGSDYEMVVRAKGFAEQTRAIDTKNSENEARIVFRMQPIAGGNK